MNLCGSKTFIIAIVPFDQIRVDFSDSSKASQLARAPGALQRARKHLGKTQSAQPFHEAARIAGAAEGGEIIASRETVEGTRFAAAPTRSLELKGLNEPLEVVAIDWK